MLGDYVSPGGGWEHNMKHMLLAEMRTWFSYVM